MTAGFTVCYANACRKDVSRSCLVRQRPAASGWFDTRRCPSPWQPKSIMYAAIAGNVEPIARRATERGAGWIPRWVVDRAELLVD